MTGLDSIGSLQTHALTSVHEVTAAEKQNKVGADTAATQVGTSDRASFSAAGELAAQGTDNSDVRLTKVAELRQAIASGTYNVSASAVADKMVESLLS